MYSEHREKVVIKCLFIHVYVLILYLKVKRYEQNTEYYLYLRRKERIILY